MPLWFAMELDEETAVMAKGTMWQNLSSIIVKLCSFVYTILVARLAAQEQVGLFYFGLSIVGIMGIFADFGLSTAIQRYIPYHLGRKEKAVAEQVIRFSVTAGTALLALCSVATFLLADAFAAFFHNPGLGPVMQLLAIQLSIYAAFNILLSLLVAFKQLHAYSVGYSAQNVLKILLLLSLIFTLGVDARSLSITYMLSFVIPCFYLMWALLKPLSSLGQHPRFPLQTYWPIAREMVPFGLTIVGVVLFSNFVAYTDRVLLGYYLSSDVNPQIAIYTIASSFAGLVLIFAGSITPIFLPVVSELIGREDRARVQRMSQTALRWTLFSSVPIAAFVCAFAAPILRSLYGASYEAGAWVLVLFSLGTLASAMGAIQRTALAGMRLVRIELYSMICGAAVNVLLCLLLIPAYGINGAAVASLAAFSVMSLVNHHYASRRMGFSFPQSAWKNLLAGAVVLAVLMLIELAAYDPLVHLPIIIPDSALLGGVLDKLIKMAVLGVFLGAGSLLYLVLVNVLHLFEPEDRAVFGKILSKFGVPRAWQTPLARMVFWDARLHAGEETK